MANSINTNSAASYASANLTKSNHLLQKSLSKLSSGSRIVDPADDAGGLAVSMKMKAALNRVDGVSSNISNAVSFLQTQASALANFSAVVSRMSELAVRISDATQNETDLDNYFTEYSFLKGELGKIAADKFNGIALFSSDPNSSLDVHVQEDGSSPQTILRMDLSNAVLAAVSSPASSADVKALSISTYTAALQQERRFLPFFLTQFFGAGNDNVFKFAFTVLATYSAAAGASMSELEQALNRNRSLKVNLEQANSRIADTDVAAESTRLAKANVLVQSGSNAVVKANQSKDALLRLLGI